MAEPNIGIKFDLSIPELEKMAKQLRRDVITMIATAGSGHPGGSLSAADIVTALYFKVMRHDPKNPAYNRHFRQLIHVGFKVAAEMGPVYYQALQANADVIGRLVTENLLEKHVKPVFVKNGH